MALILAGAIPQVSSTAKAIALLPEVLELPLRPLTLVPEPEVSAIDLPNGPADLYRSGRNAPGIVLVHGANPEGPKDPRIQQVARGLSQLGRTVLAPALALGEQRLDLLDPIRVREAIEHLSALTGGQVTVVAFSFGAAYTLVALQQEPQVQDRIAQIATIGTYFDLIHLLQGVTTGEVTAARGEMQSWTPDSEAGRIVAEFLARYLPAQQSTRLLAAIRSEDPSGLDPPARSVYDLMTNRDPDRTAELAEELPVPLPEAIRRLSPSAAMDRITVPVVAMHSRQDPASPPSESKLLLDSLEPPATGSLTLVGSFRHVTPARGPALLRDALPLIGFVKDVIDVQQEFGYH